jgi:hypothetical protein
MKPQFQRVLFGPDSRSLQPNNRPTTSRRSPESPESQEDKPGESRRIPKDGSRCEALGAEDLCPGLEGQIARHHKARAFIGRRDDVEEQLGTDLGGRDQTANLFLQLVSSRFERA